MSGRGAMLLLAAVCCHPAVAQLQLVEVNGAAEQPAPAVVNFGAIDAGDSAAVSFRLRNTSASAVQVSSITVAGTAFLLVAAQLPATVAPQASFDFLVSFQPATAGSYSATLQAAGNSVLLLGTASAVLSYQVVTNSGTQPLNGPIDFGTVTLGSSSSVTVKAVNQTAQSLFVPALAASGADFSLENASLSGSLLEPLASATFAVVFTPGRAGASSGSLLIGSHRYALGGTGSAPPLPKGSLSLSLAQTRSAQQGALTVTFDRPPLSSAAGTVVMTFAPGSGIPASLPADPAIAFASGSQTAAFTIAPGETTARFNGQASIPFSTGTTAGTLTFTLHFGDMAAQQSVAVAGAAVELSAVQGTRQANSIALQITGFDNTRTAGKLSFTFYDLAGNPVAPGGIAADSSSAFSNYFRGSGVGGVFALSASFPVSGDASQIGAFEIAVTNEAGVTRSARTSF